MASPHLLDINIEDNLSFVHVFCGRKKISIDLTALVRFETVVLFLELLNYLKRLLLQEIEIISQFRWIAYCQYFIKSFLSRSRSQFLLRVKRTGFGLLTEN